MQPDDASDSLEPVFESQLHMFLRQQAAVAGFRPGPNDQGDHTVFKALHLKIETVRLK
jgi:hypothetical protein